MCPFQKRWLVKCLSSFRLSCTKKHSGLTVSFSCQRHKEHLKHQYLFQTVLLVNVQLLTQRLQFGLTGPITHRNSYLINKHWQSLWLQSHPPSHVQHLYIPLKAWFLLTWGPSHRFFIRHSDVRLAVIDFHFIWKWSWLPQSLHRHRRSVVRTQRWMHSVAAAMPLQCPSHRVTHCVSAWLEHMHWKTN